MHARTVLVVRPAAFGWNAETAGTNTFQERREGVHAEALAEHDNFVAELRAAGVEVRVVADTPHPPKPDAVFPNNWVSFHRRGAVLYPMATPSRRAEVRPEVLARPVALDLRPLAEQGQFLEGTGSLVLDRARHLAFVCPGPRTHPAAVERFCAAMDYQPVFFDAEVDGVAPYHTNVVLALVHGVALVGDCVTSNRAGLEAALAPYRILRLSPVQVRSFCANAIGLEPGVTLMSARALAALGDDRKYFPGIVAPAIPTIEAVGGGSARCLVAEVF